MTLLPPERALATRLGSKVIPSGQEEVRLQEGLQKGGQLIDYCICARTTVRQVN